MTGALVVRVVVLSALLVGGAMWLFHWEQSNGASIAEARTSAMNVFVATEAFYLFACRSLTRGVWQIGLLSNRWILGGSGQSTGKRVLHIRLIGAATGEPIGEVRAFVRDLCHLVDMVLAYVGFFFPLWDARRQTLADKIVRTVVVPV